MYFLWYIYYVILEFIKLIKKLLTSGNKKRDAKFQKLNILGRFKFS